MDRVRVRVKRGLVDAGAHALAEKARDASSADVLHRIAPNLRQRFLTIQLHLRRCRTGLGNKQEGLGLGLRLRLKLGLRLGLRLRLRLGLG